MTAASPTDLEWADIADRYREKILQMKEQQRELQAALEARFPPPWSLVNQPPAATFDSLSRQLAEAVLAGDRTAAFALVDHLLETEEIRGSSQ